ncbi:hypothetical protein ACUN0C_10905 [Faunimonas sp. B44]|uniref:hypothetical protein n=1 Tax=Faunimonas sp. B44 TaxID=3461493 RepID=UPI004043BFD6
MNETKSALASKINWTQIVAVAAMALSLWGFDLSAEEQAEIAAAIVALQGAATVVFRTFFTRKRVDL